MGHRDNNETGCNDLLSNKEIECMLPIVLLDLLYKEEHMIFCETRTPQTETQSSMPAAKY